MDIKQKILLVDDETAIIDNLAPFLERSGFLVLTAQNGIEALQKIASRAGRFQSADEFTSSPSGLEALCQYKENH
jgi:DNA-binding NtrC family response regulator